MKNTWAITLFNIVIIPITFLILIVYINWETDGVRNCCPHADGGNIPIQLGPIFVAILYVLGYILWSVHILAYAINNYNDIKIFWANILSIVWLPCASFYYATNYL